MVIDSVLAIPRSAAVPRCPQWVESRPWLLGRNRPSAPTLKDESGHLHEAENQNAHTPEAAEQIAIIMTRLTSQRAEYIVNRKEARTFSRDHTLENVNVTKGMDESQSIIDWPYKSSTSPGVIAQNTTLSKVKTSADEMIVAISTLPKSAIRTPQNLLLPVRTGQ